MPDAYRPFEIARRRIHNEVVRVGSVTMGRDDSWVRTIRRSSYADDRKDGQSRSVCENGVGLAFSIA